MFIKQLLLLSLSLSLSMLLLFLFLAVLPRRFYIPLLSSKCNEIICKRNEVSGKWLLPSTVALYCSNRTRNRGYDSWGSGDMPSRKRNKTIITTTAKTERHMTKKNRLRKYILKSHPFNPSHYFFSCFNFEKWIVWKLRIHFYSP